MRNFVNETINTDQLISSDNDLHRMDVWQKMHYKSIDPNCINRGEIR